MLDRESIAGPSAGDGISYTEFSYMLLQSMDYLQLYRDHGCTLQVGGSDQWGNITGGLDLIRRVEGPDSRAHGLTVPLVTKADGTKFGKTAGGAIWLDPESLTTPFAFYQFWLNTDDRDVANMLRVLQPAAADGGRGGRSPRGSNPASGPAQRALGRASSPTSCTAATPASTSRRPAPALFGRGDL